MGTLFRDLRYGLRMLAKNPGFTAVAVVTLALGIGANTAIFSLMNEGLLKTLPVSRPEELVLIARGQPGGSFTYPAFEQFLERNQVLGGIFGFAYRNVDVNVGGQAERAIVQLASGRYFSTLGLNAILGRALTPSDDRVGVQPVAVISYDYWKRRFALDRSILGQTLTLASVPFSIVGVTPPGFSGVSLDYSVDVWVPMRMQPQLESGKSLLNSTSTNWVMVMGRLKRGVSEQQTRSNLNLIFQRYLRSVEAPTSASAQRVELFRGGQPVSGIRPLLSRPLSVMMVIVALVLLIACANIAILMLARSSARQKEFTVRAALGAGRARLIRQLLTESILLAILGGLLGILLARWGSDALVALTFRGLTLLPATPSITFHPDIRVLGFTLTASILAGTLFGLAPGFQATRIDLVSGLEENAASVSGRRLRLDKSLLVFQVGASLLLLIVAGLFIRSFQKMGNVNLGFNSKNLLQLQFMRFNTGYSPEKLSGIWNEMFDKIKAAPGVVSASMSVPGLFSWANYYTDITVEGEPARPRHGERDLDHAIFVSPGFFTTMGEPLVAGRDIGPQDNEHGPKVAVINQTLSRAYFHSANPVGKRILVGGKMTEIVGVASDTKYDSVLAETPTIVYLPLKQYPFTANSRVFEVRTATNATGAIPDLRRAVQSVDPGLSMDYAGPLTDLVGQSLTLQRLSARLTGFFGLLGLLLACIGLYGLMSYIVVRRTKEIGLRMVLGAEHSGVLWLVMRPALWLVLMGIGIGLGVALAAARLVSSQFFGLSTADPVAISVATLLMLGVASLAGYLPARRATKVDPMVALRYE